VTYTELPHGPEHAPITAQSQATASPQAVAEAGNRNHAELRPTAPSAAPEHGRRAKRAAPAHRDTVRYALLALILALAVMYGVVSLW
jgi:hypothetical protein